MESAATFPLLRDPELHSVPPGAGEFAREIEAARRGERATLSTRAAAHYLSLNPSTLRAMVREGIGPEPIKNPSKPGSTASNQHLRFTLAALDAFLARRSGALLTRESRTDADALRRETERLQALADYEQAKAQLAKARERAKRLGVVCFQTLPDVLEIQPWAQVDGRLVGHVWAMSPDQEEDSWIFASLEDALQQPWSDLERQRPYAEAFEWVLRQAASQLETCQRAQEQRDLRERLPPAQPGKRQPFRF